MKLKIIQSDEWMELLLSLVLIVSILIAAISVGFALGAPKKDESFSELSLLTKGKNGKFIADDYPINFTDGQGRVLYVELTNHESRTMNYTIIIELQRVQLTTNNSTQVLQRQEINRFQAHVRKNETRRIPQTITPHMSGNNLRLIYLLYEGNPPNHPTKENAYREVHLWINVSSTNK